jgi:hypothetical protein
MSKTTKVFARSWGWHPKITVYPSQCTSKGADMTEPVTDWPLAPKTGYYNIDGKRVWLEAEEPFPETAPPKKEWVGLTDEEILEEYRQSYGDDGNLTDVYFARAIEAKLKEKNT